MATYLPQNEFIPHSAPARTSPDADTADASCATPLTGASAELSNSAMPTAESAVASKAPPVADATAAPIQSSCGGVESRHTGAWTTPSRSPVAGVAPGPHEASALGDKLDWQDFWDFITDDRIILFEPFAEHPLFIIEDGSLRRLEA
jgi:hypothetical protein